MANLLNIPNKLPDDFIPTPSTGLTDEEASHRKPNVAHHRPDKSTPQILAENLFTPFNGLNAALALCLALVASWRNMLFLGVVVSNTLIGTIQELRARATIRRLSLLNAPTAHVRRNGTERTCSPEELAEGDLIILRAGDQIPADAIVTEGAGSANESLLTGESTPIRKRAGDWLLSGSYLLEGTVTAQLIHVGDDSYVARLTRSAKEIRRPKSVLMTEVNQLIRLVSAALLPIGVLLFCKQYFLLKLPLTRAVPTSVAAMIGMIPEGLILLISVALTVGVVKLGRRNTLVQELYGIETLSRADVLCLDKTGTITTGRMTVQTLVPVSGTEDTLKAALSRFLTANKEHSGTLEALRAAVDRIADDRIADDRIADERIESEKPLAVLPFSSERKKSAVSFSDGTTLILGAPTFVLDDRLLSPHRSRLDAYANQGLRVLVLAEASGCVNETDAPPVTRVLGFCLLTDEVRSSARETLSYFRAQGVQIKIISGDDEKTVAAIANRIGLEGEAVDASTLSDDSLLEACERCMVFGRVTPDRKKALVEALKARGHHVAMTGDGVNDIPALKAADCSIAMAGGSDATHQAAQLTLLDADFASMPLIVAEGRRVVGNITCAASLFLVKTLYSFVLALLTLFLPVEYPFQPIQLTLISSLTIGLPAFLLTLEPNTQQVQGNFLRTVLKRAIPGAAAVCICSMLSMLFINLGWTTDVCKTIAALCTGAIGLMMLISVSVPFTALRVAVCVLMTAGFVLAVCLFRHVFYFSHMTLAQYGALAALIVLGAAVMLMMNRLLNKKRS